MCSLPQLVLCCGCLACFFAPVFHNIYKNTSEVALHFALPPGGGASQQQGRLGYGMVTL